MDEQPSGGAPPVVAVVVTRDPGPWLEEALSALDSQDYPSLSILVIDASSAEDLTPRVAAVAPGAYVRRLAESSGYAAAANEVLSVVEGASHFLLCHDDVAPDPDALRQLVEEAFRSNAGIVGPKFVEWDQPERLLDVGLGVDKLASAAGVVDPGELDQEQYDSVRDMFAVSGACLLVRADLFASLGGFTSVLGSTGEDVELCWRAQVAGARVVVSPAARVRHLEAGHRGLRAAGPDRGIEARNRLRTVLTCYGIVHLIRVLPQAIVLGAAEALYSLVTGDIAHARAVVRAWTWNLRHLGDIRRSRKAIHASRVLGDGEVRRLQLRGSARLRDFVRSQVRGDGAGHSVATVGRDLAGSLRQGSLRLPMAVWAGLAVVIGFGSRKLIGGGIPAIGQMAPFPHSPGTFLRLFLSGWRTTGLGRAAAAPASFGFLGLAGYVSFGAMGLLRQVLVLGLLPVAAVGAYRLARPFGGRHTRLAATVVYLAVPVPYDALARGRWSGLLAYALVPFVLRRLLAATRIEPFAAAPDRRLWHEVVPLGLLVAVFAAFVPSALVLVVLLAVGLVLGSLLVGKVGASLRAVTVGAVAAVTAVVLLFPWSLDVLRPGSEWAAFTGVASPVAGGPSFGDLLRFDTGPIGAAPLGWGFLVAAVLPLLIGREWRLAWAVRLWSVAVVCWLVAWGASRGWLGIPLPTPEVLLAPAAAAMALAIALGVAAFFVDLPGYSFGVRQVVTVVAAAAVAAGALPVLAASPGGRWRAPATDDARLLAWMPAELESGAFRVLWVGSPDVLPIDGWRLAPGVAYATSRNGVPDATDMWPGASSGPTHLLAQALDVARAGRTTRLGHLLAPMGVRYLVLPTRAAPAAPGRRSPLPADLTAALQGQLDLREVSSDADVLLYENVAWAPARAALPPDAVTAARASKPLGAATVELSGATPVLDRQRGPQSFSGAVAQGTDVLVAEGTSSRWTLTVGGHRMARHTVFGWADSFEIGRDGGASLRYRTPVSRTIEVVVEAALWILALRAVVVAARRRRRRDDAGNGGAASPVTQPIVPDDGGGHDDGADTAGPPGAVGDRRPAPLPDAAAPADAPSWS